MRKNFVGSMFRLLSVKFIHALTFRKSLKRCYIYFTEWSKIYYINKVHQWYFMPIISLKGRHVISSVFYSLGIPRIILRQRVSAKRSKMWLLVDIWHRCNIKPDTYYSPWITCTCTISYQSGWLNFHINKYKYKIWI